jgi:tRNA U34 5-carboxymethylaminomethyl modifying enzyme MnmG/GidA
MGLGYKGIMKSNENNEEVSNEIRVSSVPQGEKKIALISYNKDGYMTYCKAYKEFWGENGWMKVRNEERYNDNILSGQNYDGKNMSHCLRLLYMAKEISEGKGIIVRRSEDNRKELLSVKKGEWSYETIIAKCEELTFGLKEAYEHSDLPETVDYDKIVNILNKFRKKVYGL